MMRCEGRRSGSSTWRTALITLLVAGGCRPPTDIAVVGPAGGSATFKAAEGELTLDVPAGGLAEPTEVSIKAKGPAIIGNVVELGPDGLRFDEPVKLRARVKLSPAVEEALGSRLTWARRVDGRWETLESSATLNAEELELTAKTSHFSTYALITECRASGTGNTFPVPCPALGDLIVSTATAVTLDARAGAAGVVVRLQKATGSTQLTVSGLTSGQTYFVYVDGFATPLPRVASSSGEITFPQDLTTDHVVVLQKQAGGMALSSATCAQVGTFDAATATCRLNKDIAFGVSVEQGPFTLDCGAHSIGSLTAAAAVGILVSNRNDVRVRGCRVLNAQVGLVASSSSRTKVESTTFSMASGSEGDTAVLLHGGLDVAVTAVNATRYATGLEARQGANLTAKELSVAPTFAGVRLRHQSNAQLEDVRVDGSARLPNRAPLAGVLVEAGTNGRVNGLDAAALDGFSFGVRVADAVATISHARVSGAQVGVTLSATQASTLQDSVVTANGIGLTLSGQHRVFHNNVFGNGALQVQATGTLELSSAEQEGNYWGRSCPGALFLAGTDSSSATVTDSFPFSQLNGWSAGATKGCELGPPTLTAPVSGTATRESRPQVRGTAAPGATVSLWEVGVQIGAATASPTGVFTVQPSAPLSEGLHTLTAVAVLAGRSSRPSAPLRLRVDSAPPSVPVILVPETGMTFADASPSVAGTAEPGTWISVFEGAQLVGQGATSASGRFDVSPTKPFAPGQHAVRARARDAAGNQSALSAAVSFSVMSMGAGVAQLAGSRGRLMLRALSHGPNPFRPGVRANVLTVSGDIAPAAESAGANFTLHVRRAFRLAGAAQPVALTTTVGAASVAPFSAQSSWDGRNAAGALVAPGTYIAVTQLALTRGAVAACPTPFATPNAACVVDMSPQLYGTVTMSSPTALEECNGKDDDGDEIVDEGCGYGCMGWASEVRGEACEERMPFGLFDTVEGGGLFGPVNDFVSPAPGPMVTFTRTWSSGLAFTHALRGHGPMGHGWTHVWNERALPEGAPDGSDVLLYRGDGGVDRFRNVGAAQWLSPRRARRHLKLTGGQYEVIKEDGSSWFFDVASGKLMRVANPGGLQATLTYYGAGAAPCTAADGPAGELCRIDFPCGRTLRLWYESSPEGSGHVIERVTWGPNEFNDAMVTFRWSAQGFPPRAVLSVATYRDLSEVTYHYDQVGETVFLGSIIDEDGFEAETLKYDDLGRVSRVSTRMQSLVPTYSPGRTRIDDDLNGGCWNVELLRDAPAGITAPGGCDFVSRGVAQRGWSENLDDVLFTRSQREIITTYSWDVAGVVRSIANDDDLSAETVPPPADDVRVVEFTNHPLLDVHTSACHRSVLSGSARHCTVWDFDATPACVPLSSCTDPSQFNQSPTLLPYRTIEMGLTKDIAGTTQPFQHVTSTTYDSVGRLSSIDGPRSDVTDVTSLRYWSNTDPADRCGRPRTITTRADGVDLITFHSAYNRLGQATATTDSNGHQTLAGFDARGRQTSGSGPNGETALASYTPTGQPLTNRNISGTAYTYHHGANALVDTVYKRPSVGSGTYTDRVDLVFDAANRVQRQVSSARLSGIDVPADAWSHTYDNWGRPKSVGKHRSSALTATSSTTYSYSADSHVTGIADDNHSSENIRYGIDALGRVSGAEALREGSFQQMTSFGYDFHSNLRRLTDAEGRELTQLVDDLGRVLEQTAPDTGTTRFEYNEAGAVVKSVAADGVLASLSYDAAGRTTHTSVPGIELVSTYDTSSAPSLVDCRTQQLVLLQNLTGRLARLDDTSGTTWHSYDLYGRPVLKARRNSWETCLRVTRWTYDNQGRLTSMVYPTGRTVTYGYSSEDADQLATVSVTFNGSPVAVIHAVHPHVFGGARQWTFGNGLIANIDRHLDREVKAVSLRASGALLQHQLIDVADRDGVGNVLAIHDLVTPGLTESFSYDFLNRLKTAQHATPALGLAYGQVSYTYGSDEGQNRYSVTRDGVLSSYTYAPGTSRLATAGATTYGHDQRGNVNSVNSGSGPVTVQHDALGRLTAYGPTQYQYDASGVRVRKGPAPFTDFYYSGAELLAEVGPYSALPASMKEYVYFEGRPVAMVESTLNANGTTTDLDIFYIHTDQLGAPVLMTDASRAVVWRAEYEPFGRQAVAPASTKTLRLAFPGQYVDVESGLHYNWLRYYSPVTGRYFEPDFGVRGHITPYGYADLSPQRLTDPMGAFPVFSAGWTTPNLLKVLNATITAGALNAGAPFRNAGRWASVGAVSVAVWIPYAVVAKAVAPLLSIFGNIALVVNAVAAFTNSTMMPSLMSTRLPAAGFRPLFVTPTSWMCAAFPGTCRGGLQAHCGAVPFLDCFGGTVTMCPSVLGCDAAPTVFGALFGLFGSNPFATCVLGHEAGHTCGAPPGVSGAFPEILADDASQAVFGTGAASGAGCRSFFAPAGFTAAQPLSSPGLFGFTPP